MRPEDPTSEQRDRAVGALAGLALGDALGMPTQSMSRAQIATHYGRIQTLVDALAVQPVAPSRPAGTITDDTEQALLLARLLVEGGGRIDPLGFADALAAWETDMAARGWLDLLGPSTRLAIARLRAGEPPEVVGRDGTTNGAAMRVAPVGIAVPATEPDTLLASVVAASSITHGTSTGIAAAAAVAAAVCTGIAGGCLADALDAAEQAAAAGARLGRRTVGGQIAGRIRRARGLVAGLDAAAVADTVADRVGTSVAAQESVVAAFALVAALGDDPLAALTTAAGVGGDTDTIAAICGAVLGAHHGVAGLPAELVATVLRVNSLDLAPVADALLALRHGCRR